MDNGRSLDNSAQPGQRKVTIAVTPDDQVGCNCGNTEWHQPVLVFRVQSQLIGQKPVVTVQPCTSLPIVCSKCLLPLSPEGIKTLGDRKRETVKPTDEEIRIAARAQALRTVTSLVRQAEVLGVTPEHFAELIDQENKAMSAESSPQIIT